MAEINTLAESLNYMERKALRRSSRGQRIPYTYIWKLREMGLTDSYGLTDLGQSVLRKINEKLA